MFQPKHLFEDEQHGVSQSTYPFQDEQQGVFQSSHLLQDVEPSVPHWHAGGSQPDCVFQNEPLNISQLYPLQDDQSGVFQNGVFQNCVFQNCVSQNCVSQNGIAQNGNCFIQDEQPNMCQPFLLQDEQPSISQACLTQDAQPSLSQPIIQPHFDNSSTALFTTTNSTNTALDQQSGGDNNGVREQLATVLLQMLFGVLLRVPPTNQAAMSTSALVIRSCLQLDQIVSQPAVDAGASEGVATATADDLVASLFEGLC